MLVEALVTEPAVEALDEAILHRFAWCDVVPLDATLLLPGQDGVRGQLGAVVADDHARIVTQFGDPIEFTGDPQAGERRVHDQTEAFPREVIDQRQELGSSVDWLPLSAYDLLLLLGVAVCFGLAIYFVALAFRGGEISVVTPFRYTALLWAANRRICRLRRNSGRMVAGRCGADRGERALRPAPQCGAMRRNGAGVGESKGRGVGSIRGLASVNC